MTRTARHRRRLKARPAAVRRCQKRDGVELVTADDKKKSNAIVDEDVVRALARLLDETRLTEIEIEQRGWRVRVARQATVTYAPPAPEATRAIAAAIPAGALDPSHHPAVVASPIVGTPYPPPHPRPKPFSHLAPTVN